MHSKKVDRYGSHKNRKKRFYSKLHNITERKKSGCYVAMISQKHRAHLLFCFGQVNPVWFVALFSARGA